jgi:uncharacterized BrkB/YihY/UPF0761 family membrane protein
MKKSGVSPLLLFIFILIIVSTFIKRTSEYIKLQNDPNYTNKKLHYQLIIGIILIVFFMLIYFMRLI